MGRFAKWAGAVAGALVVLLALAAGAIYWLSNARMQQHFAVQVQAVPVLADPQSVTEGERIFVTRGCVDCHGTDLAGRTFIDDPMVGRFTGANLTKGQGGIGGTFTNEDFVRAIRHGVAPDGRALLLMPSTDFYAMSDRDIALLIAYIRSVLPVDRPAPVQQPGPLARVLLLAGKLPLLVTAELIDHSFKAVEVPVAVTVDYGRYVAMGCTGCHGPGYQGGPIPGGPPEWPPARNLTQDPENGLGKWDEADFVKAMRTGVRPDGTKLRVPMPWENFSRMTDTELKALWMFLKTLQPEHTTG